jgi:hypothetical protein
MANRNHFQQSANVKSIQYPGREPKKLKKIKIPVQDISLLDMYDTIDQVPEEIKHEYIRLILAD